MKKIYHVRASHYTGKWWSLQGIEQPGCIGQARKLSKVDYMAEAFSMLDGIPEEDIQVELVVDINPKRNAQIQRCQELAERIRPMQEELSRLQMQLACDLVNIDKLTYRDAATILELSHQRIGQLVLEDRAKTKLAS